MATTRYEQATQHDHAPAPLFTPRIPTPGMPTSDTPTPEIPAQRQAPPVRVMPPAPRRARQRWPVTVGGLAAGLALGTLGAIGGAEAVTAEQATPLDTQGGFVANLSVPGRVKTSFGDGSWQIGVDVAPGTYTTTGAVDPDCVHALRTTATLHDVVQGAGYRGPATVVLGEQDEWFVTSGCATWHRTG